MPEGTKVDGNFSTTEIIKEVDARYALRGWLGVLFRQLLGGPIHRPEPRAIPGMCPHCGGDPSKEP